MLSLILEARATVQFVLGLTICLAMLRYGGGPERWLAWVWLTLEFVDRIYHAIFASGVRLDELDVGHAMLDAGATFVLVGIALNANRIYPLWIAAFQIIAATAHVAREMADTVSPLAYAFMTIAPSYFQLMFMAGGIYLHRRRIRKFGRYRDWRQPQSATA